MFTEIEIRQKWDSFTDVEQDGMSFEEFRRQVRDVFNPEKNTRILQDILIERAQQIAVVREKRRIDKALQQKKVSID